MKRVGRPKKNVSIMKTVTSIIQKSSNSKYNKVEITSRNIQYFKQLIHLIKEIGLIHVYIKFNLDSVIFYAPNKLNNGGVVAIIPSHGFDLHNHNTSLIIQVPIYELNDILSSATIDYNYVSFVLTNVPMLKITYINTVLSEENISILKPETCFEELWLPLIEKTSNLSDYPIKFTIQIKILKKRLVSYIKHSNSIILKYKDNSIIFKNTNTVTLTSKKIKYTNLSNLNVSVFGEYKNKQLAIMFDLSELLSFVSSFTNDNVTFYMHPTYDLILQINNITMGTITQNIPLQTMSLPLLQI